MLLRNVSMLLIVAALLLSACGGGAPPATTPAGDTPVPPASDTPAPPATDAPEPPADTGEPASLRIGWLDTPDTLNPAYAFLSVSYDVFDLVYSSLVKEGLDGEYVGDLAESWQASEDGLSWTFTLKDGIKWHTGEDFTAEDLAWAINTIKDDPEGWATLVNYTNGFNEVTAPDDRTIQITLDYPIGNMLYRVSFLYAIYRPDFEPLETVEDLQNFANDVPIGTGLFKMNQFDKDRGVAILDANPDFYDGRAIIDQVIFQKFDNEDALVQALRVGDIDLVTAVPSAAFETVKTFEDVTTVQQPSRSFDELIINVASEDLETNTGSPALRDPVVREALAHAVNKQDLVDIVLQGLGDPAWSIVSPSLGGGFWINTGVTDREFDLDRANQLLDEAGYTLGADGVREKDGVRLDLRLQFDSDTAEYARIADLLTDWFGQIGVKVTPEAVDSDTLIAATTGVGDFDLVIWGWGGDPDPDFILSIMLCEQFEVGGWSDSGYCNAEYDQLYLDQQQAVDQDERKQIIDSMQDMLFRDLPYIVFYNYEQIQAYRSDRFTGFPEAIANPALSTDFASAFVLQKVEPVR